MRHRAVDEKGALVFVGRGWHLGGSEMAKVAVTGLLS